MHFNFSEHDSGTLFDHEEVTSAQWIAVRLLLPFILLALFLLTKSEMIEIILWFYINRQLL